MVSCAITRWRKAAPCDPASWAWPRTSGPLRIWPPLRAEITRYGTLLAWAAQLGLAEAEALIQETLVEEENTDQLLPELAEEAVNPAAAA